MATTEIKRLPKDEIPCKFAEYYTTKKPYDDKYVELQRRFVCATMEDFTWCLGYPKCTSYQPVEVKICVKHNAEYVDFCSDCENEMSEGF